MIDSVSAADTFSAERFARVGVAADGEAAARLREEFARWLEMHFELDPVRSSDLLLATNEALANAAEFAYWEAAVPGTMDLDALFDPTTGTLTVTIVDRGTWREKTPEMADRARGRGIPLMEALTDRAAIDTTSGGTRVQLQWTGITAPPATVAG
ncbi:MULTISPECIES: ATP-binding protein [Mycobacteriaceae]|uniref:ATP-binding protein n=1 Tax=Mycobacteriaceae TaxID=1762 RepID=UPI0008003F8C|nr:MULTISPECIES: ATP-binding protein [Mycobacteriaceae]MCK0174150.1 ATP-binding protein [Mycolicibacterium sp. F2034L]OBB62018.1 anti-sigma regulatory factor [Mycobacterium sp. 852013-51886_SCH5428379]